MLVQLDEELNADGIQLVFAELKDPVRDKLERFSIYDTIDPNHFYPAIKTAIRASARRRKRQRQQRQRQQRQRRPTRPSGGLGSE